MKGDTEAGRDKTRLAHSIRKALPAGLAALLFVATAASFLGPWSWLLDLLSHFRPQLAALGIVSMAVALLARSRIALVLSLCLTAVNAAPLMPYFVGNGADESGDIPDQSRFRVLTFNLYGHHTDPAAFRRMIERENPDIVLLEEVPRDTGFLEGWESRYSYRISEHGGVPLDVVLFSRWKPLSLSVDRSVAQFRSVLTARFCQSDTANRCFTFVGLHADQPFEEGARRQQGQLDIAEREIGVAREDAVLLMGDLNMTPWSRAFRTFVARTGLSDTARTKRLSSTWRSRSLLLGLPIDHILVNRGFRVIENRLGEDLGSDHLPVIADLAFKAE